MEFKVNCGIWGAMFGIPVIVADNFLKLATGDQIKVLLYLLRHSGRMCSSEEISSNTGVSQEAAEEAVLFWQQANVLSPQKRGSQVPVIPLMAQQELSDEPQEAPKPQTSAPNHKTSLSGKEIATIMNNSRDISELFQIIESILGALTNGQMNSLIWMYDHLGLKKEVIVTLISYCKQIDKTNTNYIDKIAISWAEKNINTLENAQNETQRLLSSRDYTVSILRIIEQTQSPTTKQNKIIEEWQNNNVSIELIKYANEKAIERGKKGNFIEYINGIILNWRNNGLTTIQDVKNAENEYKKKKSYSNNTQSTSDADEYKFVINDFLH